MTINPVIIVSANDIAFPTPTAEDKLRLAVAGYLSKYKGKTLSGHTYALNLGKGGNTYAMPLSIPVMRAVHEVIDGRTEGPILVTKWKTRMSKSSARRTIKLIAAAAAVNEDISPHSLRRSFATTAIATGVPIRDLQVTLRHKSIKTTTIYDRGGKSHDRNSTHRVSSFIAGIADM